MNMDRDERIGCVQVFVAGALWGVIGVFVKQLERCGSTVETTSLLRVLLAFLIMALICTVKYGVKAFAVSGRTLLICALLGVICHGVYNLCYSAAVTAAGVAVSAVLLDVAPVFTLLFSVMLFKERLTVRKLAAIAINIVGCVLTATDGRLSMEQAALTGLLYGVGAGVCYSLTAIIGRFAAEKTDPFVMSMYSYLFAAIFLAFCFDGSRLVITGEILLWSFGYALVPTAIAYIIYYQGISRISESSKVPLIASIEVVIAGVLGVLLYGERLGAVSILGIALVLLSIALMNIKSMRWAA